MGAVHYAWNEILIFTVRAALSRQASTESVIMACPRENMQHRKAISLMRRKRKSLTRTFPTKKKRNCRDRFFDRKNFGGYGKAGTVNGL